MPKVVLVAGRAYQIPLIEHADYYGVDHGAICCMHQQIKMKKAIGDFDSITFDELEELKKNTKVIQLPTHKDETDSEAAILIAMEDGYDEIILFGGLGGRIDHEMVNLHLMLYRDYPLTLMDENNTVKVLSKGTYEVEKTHRYLSFLPLEESCISSPFCRYHSSVTGRPFKRVVLTLDKCTSFQPAPSRTIAAWRRLTEVNESSKRTWQRGSRPISI